MHSCMQRGSALEEGCGLTFPIRLLWAQDLQDIDAAPAVGRLQNHVRIDADFVTDPVGSISCYERCGFASLILRVPVLDNCIC
jgi:hypothetical protein